MKKNLLALFALGAICTSLNAQTNTYINDNVIVKVNPNTLFYNGGSVSVATAATSGTTEKIINQGNIQIAGGFTNANTTGKNFVNKYTSSSSYGQLIIANTATTVTGNVAIERSIPNTTNNDEYVIALPFKGSTASKVINSLTGSTTLFRGDCAPNVDCGSNARYNQTLFEWDARETEYDAVQAGTITKPGIRYLMRFKNSDNVSLNNFASAINTLTGNFNLASIPNNEDVTIDLKSGLKGGDQAYKSATWSSWKNMTNNYGEGYYTYLGNNSGSTYDANPIFGKNLHRLGNPFTSNLDLSDVSTANTWIKFKLTSNTDYTTSPTQGFNSIRFRVYKIADNFTIKTSNSGNITTRSTPISAYLYPNGSGQYFWIGNPDALLVKPYETFHIDYYQFKTADNNSGFVTDARVTLTHRQKTFNYGFTTTGTAGSPPGAPYLYSRSAATNNEENTLSSLLNNEELKAKGLVTDFDFTQLELFLSDTDENILQGNAAYLANSNFMVTGNAQVPTSGKVAVDNPVFFFEETKDGEVLTNVQSLSNHFNSEDYIGKPLAVGFNNLEEGKEYRLNLNLYEYSILNRVDNLNLGKYYLLDTKTNKVVDVNGSTELTFVYDDSTNERFKFYWNEAPKTLSTDDLTKNNTTYLYTNNNKDQYVRFEKSNTTADINIYDLTGRQIFTKSSVSTNADFKLEFNNIPSVYVIKIIYKDGKTVTKKTINK